MVCLQSIAASDQGSVIDACGVVVACVLTFCSIFYLPERSMNFFTIYVILPRFVDLVSGFASTSLQIGFPRDAKLGSDFILVLEIMTWIFVAAFVAAIVVGVLIVSGTFWVVYWKLKPLLLPVHSCFVVQTGKEARHR